MAQLTAKQQRFVEEYLVDLNATQAAIRCGYSAKTAKQQGSRLLTNADVREAVEAGQEKIAAGLEISHDDVTRGLIEIARHGESETARVRAWELVGKHIAYFPKERVEHELPSGIEVKLSFDPRPAS